jgi:hypothetical protein
VINNRKKLTFLTKTNDSVKELLNEIIEAIEPIKKIEGIKPLVQPIKKIAEIKPLTKRVEKSIEASRNSRRENDLYGEQKLIDFRKSIFVPYLRFDSIPLVRNFDFPIKEIKVINQFPPLFIYLNCDAFWEDSDLKDFRLVSRQYFGDLIEDVINQKCQECTEAKEELRGFPLEKLMKDESSLIKKRRKDESSLLEKVMERYEKANMEYSIQREVDYQPEILKSVFVPYLGFVLVLWILAFLQLTNMRGSGQYFQFSSH